MPRRNVLKLQPVDWLTGQFVLNDDKIAIPGHGEATLTFPTVYMLDPNPTNQPGTYDVSWSEVLSGPVTISLGRLKFVGRITAGYNYGDATETIIDGEGTASWENCYSFTFAGDWSNGWFSWGEIEFADRGGEPGEEYHGGMVTMATRTPARRVMPPRKTQRTRKRTLATR